MSAFSTFLGLIAATTPPASTESDPAEANAPIIVEGQRSERNKSREFVEQIVTETPTDQIATTTAPLCPASTGLPAGYNEALVGAMRSRLTEFDFKLTDEGCAANLTVIFTDQPNELVKRLSAQSELLFYGMSLPDRERLASEQSPIVWSRLEMRGADGRKQKSSNKSGRSNFDARFAPVAILDGISASRITKSTRVDIFMTFMIIDIDQVAGKSLQQIADYAVMRGPGGAQAQSGGKFDTILNLFDGRDVTNVVLSSWDRSFLSALYSTDNVISAHHQKAAIAKKMAAGDK